MNKRLINKKLAEIVILLFIGIAVAPSINNSVVKASNDNDLVEVTTEACGIKGFGNTTVKLTREQYQNLEQYLVDFRARLNTTKTREEAVPIFKEAVVELNKYGLLPKGMSVEQAQKLVIASYQQKLKIEKFLEKNQENSLYNICCLVSGRTTMTVCGFLSTNIISYCGLFTKHVCWAFSFLSLLFDAFFHLRLLALFCNNASFLFDSISEHLYSLLIRSFTFFNLYFPYCLGFIEIGHERIGPAEGWIQTVGILGHRSVNGSFYGQITPIILHETQFSLDNKGILGFQGFRILLNKETTEQFYLGTALLVTVNSTSP